MNILFLDDEQDRVETFERNTGLKVTWVKDYDEFVEALSSSSKFDLIMLDHDLGTDETGLDCMRFLVQDEEWRSAGQVQHVLIHSSNFIGVSNMVSMAKYADHLKVDFVYAAYLKAKYSEEDGLSFGLSPL